MKKRFIPAIIVCALGLLLIIIGAIGQNLTTTAHQESMQTVGAAIGRPAPLFIPDLHRV